MSDDASTNESTRLPKSVTIGKYKIVAHIATGGMGAVYRALDTQTNQEVALKVLNTKMAARQDARERFYREAHLAAQLQHENIVKVHEVAEDKGIIYFVMDFVDGIDLADYIIQESKLSIDEARLIAYQSARALKHASKRGIIHRDVKPSNILLTRSSGRLVAKLTDFGLSREKEDKQRLTRLGSTVGTIDYIAPEQARDSGSADVRSDIYSLGCTLYHMLTGEPPFAAGEMIERVKKHISVEPLDVRQLRPDVPAPLVKVLKKMLAKDPADRQQTPKQLMEELLQTGGQLRRRRTSLEPATGSGTKASAAHPFSDEFEAHSDDDLEAYRPGKDLTAKQIWILVGIIGAIVFGLILILIISRLTSTPRTPDRRVFVPEVEEQAPVTPPPVERPWPALRPDMPRIDREELARRFTAVQDVLPPEQGARVLRVRRQPRDREEFASLDAALRAVAAQEASPGRLDSVIELHDNGPLHVAGLTLAGRSVLVRAAAGYRPLLAWDGDVPPLLALRGGSLGLEGLEVVLHSAKATGQTPAFVQVTGGNFQARACSFSASGAEPAVVARMNAGRCRLSRCLTRGEALTALDAVEGVRDVLLDESLLIGGAAPILDCHVRADGPMRLHLLRSTLVSGGAAVRVSSDAADLPADTFRCLSWDVLFAHSGAARESTLLELPSQLERQVTAWQGINTVYAGWRLPELTGAERFEADPWPTPTDPVAVTSPLHFRTDRAKGRPAGFAATSWPTLADGPAPTTLGCPVTKLPPTRDRWPQWVGDRFRTPEVDLPRDAAPPEIAAGEEDVYRGERIDVSTTDVGARLAEQSDRLGERVVLRLFRTGPRGLPSSAIRVRDADLVVYFESDKVGDRPTLQVPVVEVINGNLDLSGGELRQTEEESRLPKGLVEVRGGSLRLHDCHLYGPVSFERGQDERPQSVAIHQSIIASEKYALRLGGANGVRVRLAQSVLVAATNAIELRPGSAAPARLGVSCVLDNVTIAAGRAAVDVGALPEGVIEEPLLLQTRNCAFLNPFADRAAGLLLCEGDALARGALLWQGDADVYDKRLHFGVATPRTIPDRAEPNAVWQGLWGRAVRRSRGDFDHAARFDKQGWPLARLAVERAGADFKRLGVLSDVRR